MEKLKTYFVALDTRTDWEEWRDIFLHWWNCDETNHVVGKTKYDPQDRPSYYIIGVDNHGSTVFWASVDEHPNEDVTIDALCFLRFDDIAPMTTANLYNQFVLETLKRSNFEDFFIQDRVGACFSGSTPTLAGKYIPSVQTFHSLYSEHFPQPSAFQVGDDS